MEPTRKRVNFDGKSVHVNLFLPEDMAEEIDKYRDDSNRSAAFRRVLAKGLEALRTEAAA